MTRSKQSAGSLIQWLQATHIALRDNKPADVPCGSCDACCRASQFIHIYPGEPALDNVPVAARTQLQDGSGMWIMGYDENGHCPMLSEQGCSIYPNRPHACRTYDCRVFAATGIEAAQGSIQSQVLRWHFEEAPSHPADTAAAAVRQSLLAAADYLQNHRAALDLNQDNPVALALSTIKLQGLFMATPTPDLEVVKAALDAPARGPITTLPP